MTPRERVYDLLEVTNLPLTVSQVAQFCGFWTDEAARQEIRALLAEGKIMQVGLGYISRANRRVEP